VDQSELANHQTGHDQSPSVIHENRIDGLAASKIKYITRTHAEARARHSSVIIATYTSENFIRLLAY